MALTGRLLPPTPHHNPKQLSCEFATLDVSDAMGLKRLNLTKTVRKQPITEGGQRAGRATEDKQRAEPLYDEQHPVRGGCRGVALLPLLLLLRSLAWLPARVLLLLSSGSHVHRHLTSALCACASVALLPLQGEKYENANFSTPLTAALFETEAKKYDVLLVNFFAPWCPWCAGWVLACLAAFGGSGHREPALTVRHAATASPLRPQVPAAGAHLGGGDGGDPQAVPRGRRPHPAGQGE